MQREEREKGSRGIEMQNERCLSEKDPTGERGVCDIDATRDTKSDAMALNQTSKH